jgi:hypothetical protein
LAAQPAALAADVNLTGSAKEAFLLENLACVESQDYTPQRIQIRHDWLPKGFCSWVARSKMEFPMKLQGKPRVGMLVVLAVLLACAILLPEVVSAAWHVAHGRSVTYRSWKVEVPFGWYAMSHGEGMSVARMSELPWKDGPTANFLPVHFTKTYPFSYELFGKEQALTLQGRGYLPFGQRNLQVAGKAGRCWRFYNQKNHNELWIACIVPEDLISADYIGDEADSNAFLSLLTAIQRNPGVTN